MKETKSKVKPNSAVKSKPNASPLPIMEQFYSIQGEGYYSGRPAVFIRLGGCDVGCVWCDVKESWDAAKHPKTPINKIVAFVKKSNTQFVVVTGGEPAMYDLTHLTEKLKELEVEIAIETSGVYEIKGEFDWVCFSPKKFKKPNEDNYLLANELKVIVFNKSDFKWAEGHREKLSPHCKLYLQPEWSKQEELTPLVVEYVKKHPEWNISLQTHKYINVP
jgi:7-carboxy-7-deazaguanine synthase